MVSLVLKYTNVVNAVLKYTNVVNAVLVKLLSKLSLQVQHVSYQCQHRHILLSNPYQTNGHFLISNQCQHGQTQALKRSMPNQWTQSYQLSMSTQAHSQLVCFNEDQITITVIKAESIPTNLYLDIYVRD